MFYAMLYVVNARDVTEVSRQINFNKPQVDEKIIFDFETDIVMDLMEIYPPEYVVFKM